MNSNTHFSQQMGATPEDGFELKKMVDTARGLPELRLERIEALRQAISDGSYLIDEEAVADKLIEHTLRWPRG